MKVTTSEVEGSQVVLEMEIEPERVEKAMDRAYRRIVSRVNVPGFRKGKAPRHLIERLVGRDTLVNEALEILLPEAYQEAIREAGIEPVDSPKLDVISAEPLSVRATVPVRPKVELGDYHSIRQSQETFEITEEQVEQALEELRQSRAQWVPVEREAGVGDMLGMSLMGRAGDTTFLDARDASVVLDPNRPILTPGVVEQLVGMKPGERKEIHLALPEDHSDRELAGKEVVLEAAVGDIKEKQLPELDDSLARSVGEYTTLDELRIAVRRELEEQARVRARRDLEESVLQAVIQQARAEPPAPWVEEQAETLRSNTVDRLKRDGLTFEQFLRIGNETEESYRSQLLSAARTQLQRALVLSAVANAEGISVSDDEVDAALSEAAGSRGGKMDAAERERFRSSLRTLLKDRKTLDRLVAIAEGDAEEPQPVGDEEAIEKQTETQEVQ